MQLEHMFNKLFIKLCQTHELVQYLSPISMRLIAPRSTFPGELIEAMSGGKQ